MRRLALLSVLGIAAIVTAGTAAMAQIKEPNGFPLKFARVAVVTDSSLLARPVGGELGADGAVVVVDLQDARVHVFSSEGRLLVSVGTRGSGPGEFRAPTRAILTKNGEIVVYDQANHQFSRFAASGTFIERKVLDVDFRSIDNVVSLPDGGIAVAGVSLDPRLSGSPVHVFDAEFRYLRSFGPLPAHSSFDILTQVGVGTVSLDDSRGLLFTRRAPFEVVRLTLSGATAATYSPRLASIQALDEAVATSSVGMRTTSSLADVTLPTRAFALPNGMILTGRFNRGERLWDVLDQNGKAVWSGTAPGGLSTQVLGVDARRNVLWLLGLNNDTPALFRVELAR